MSKETKRKTIGVALGVCLVCSILVSAAAVSLKGKQNENKKLDKLKNILIAGDLYSDKTDIDKTFREHIKPQLINLENGHTLSKDEYTDKLNLESFDIKVMAADNEFGKSISASDDIAGIKRQPKFMVIYNVVENNAIQKVILPLYGKGLWSTMYGFIALGKDLKTIKGFTFYEHGETPGLGGEIDNPGWKKTWVGKKAYDDNWNVVIEVLKGMVDPTSPKAGFQIDGLSGSTLTTRGVDNLVKYWLGKNGYTPYIAKLQEGGINE